MNSNLQPDTEIPEASRRGPRRGPLRQIAHHGLRLATILAVFTVTITLIGFVRFTDTISTISPPASENKADAIVVLTGGAHRIQFALDLLQKGEGKRLLISGVNPATSEAELRRLTGFSKAIFDCCVDIGYEAIDTIGNASETAKWIGKNGFARIIVVTNDYHIPRSILELETASPQAAFLAWPVETVDEQETAQDESPERVRTLVYEYLKYQIARLRSLADRDPASGLRVAATSANASLLSNE